MHLSDLHPMGQGDHGEEAIVLWTAESIWFYHKGSHAWIGLREQRMDGWMGMEFKS